VLYLGVVALQLEQMVASQALGEAVQQILKTDKLTPILRLAVVLAHIVRRFWT